MERWEVNIENIVFLFLGKGCRSFSHLDINKNNIYFVNLLENDEFYRNGTRLPFSFIRSRLSRNDTISASSLDRYLLKDTFFVYVLAQKKNVS